MKTAYISGSLFTESDRGLLEKIGYICKELGIEPYLPHIESGIFIRSNNNSETFYNSNKECIDKSKIIIAVLNGTDVDSGTAWELGYANAKGKKIIGFLDDARIFNPSRQLNIMVLNSLNHLANDLDSLKEILCRIK